MKTPDIDKRTKKDIIAWLAQTSSAYTPEWRFDEKNPDVGTALSLIFADMFSGTIRRLNQVVEKNKTAFFNSLNARLLPSIPAAGYITFGLAGDTDEGTAVKAGAQMVADVEDEESGRLIFETVNDVYVTPARLEKIYAVSGRQDVISRIYAREEFEQNPAPFYLFDFNEENLQEHALYFCQKGALSIKQGAWIEIGFVPYYQNEISGETLQSFLDERIARWEYLTAEGYREFDGSKLQDGKLLFFKSERQPAFALSEQNGVENYWIRCVVKDIGPFQDLTLDKLNISSQGTGLLPDSIIGAGVEEDLHECFPFGEKMFPFGDVYFASEEALTKKGALVKLNFNLNFVRIPIDLDLGDPNINWKLIMRRSEFKPDVEYDITIEDVLWEYYNGQGWARLFPDNAYRDTFSTRHGTMGQYRSIEFICPMDMEKILIGAHDSCFIRCRILKLNNLYKTKGFYVTPLIDGPYFAYEYTGGAVLPDYLYTVNNLKQEAYQAGDLRDGGRFFRPFQNIGDERSALYLGFTKPPEEGPVKLLFSLKDAMQEKPPRLTWEYYGQQGWTDLNNVDETENLRKTGIVTFMGAGDFQRQVLWAEDLYWIRATDVEERYNDRRNPLQLPQVKGLHLNATQIIHLETRTEELFSIAPQEENYSCKLLYPHIQEIEVRVDEAETGEGLLLRQLGDKDDLKLVRDNEGRMQEAWVRWEEVEDLALSGPDDRHYQVDRNEGRILFGNGINGRIPPSGDFGRIRVAYRTGGGKAGNLAAGLINKSNLSIGFVSEIANPENTSGGCDQETVQEALARGGAALRHGYRGVTARDYESLAMEATRNIWKAKCFAGYNENGLREPGSVTLVILQKDFQHGRNYFGKLKEQVFQYVSAHISGNIIDLNRFFVIEPNFLELAVKVELSVEDFNLVFQVKEQIEKRLEEFIHPMTGNFDGKGWEIGAIPNRTQLLNCLKGIEGISFLKNVMVSAYTEGKFGRMEADLDADKDRLFALPISGRHEVLITVAERR